MAIFSDRYVAGVVRTSDAMIVQRQPLALAIAHRTRTEASECLSHTAGARRFHARFFERLVCLHRGPAYGSSSQRIISADAEARSAPRPQVAGPSLRVLG